MIVTLGALASVAGCSALRVGYDNADTLLIYTFDSYLELDDGQTEFLRRRVKAVLEWHRATQLRDYATQLAAIQARIGTGNLSGAEVLAYIDLFDARLAAIGAQAAPDFAQLGATLQPAQIEHLRAKLAQDADKARRRNLRYAGPGGLDERVASYVERAEPWFGSFGHEQLDLIRASLAARPAAQVQWAEEVERRGNDLAGLLERQQAENPEPVLAADWMRDYFLHLSAPEDERRRAWLEENRRDNAALIAQLINAASPKQRTHLMRRLGQYADDFAALAAEGTGAGAG